MRPDGPRAQRAPPRSGGRASPPGRDRAGAARRARGAAEKRAGRRSMAGGGRRMVSLASCFFPVSKKPPVLLRVSGASPFAIAKAKPRPVPGVCSAPSPVQSSHEAGVEFYIVTFWANPPDWHENSPFVTDINPLHPFPSVPLSISVTRVFLTATGRFYRYLHGIQPARCECIPCGSRVYTAICRLVYTTARAWGISPTR